MARPHLVPYVPQPREQPGKVLAYVVRNMYQPAGNTECSNNGQGWVPVEWEENLPFEATLTIVDITEKNFVLKDHKTNNSYRMLRSEALKLIANNTLVNGSLEGQWVAINKGGVYSVELF